MPLESGRSKKAFSHNVRAEMHAGKSQNQAVAIAYHEAGEKPMKHNYKGKPCMACGGAVCNLNYTHLRDQVEKERNGGDGIPSGMEGHGLGRMAAGGRVAQDDAGMAYGPGSDSAIKKGGMMPLGRGRYAEGGTLGDAIGYPKRYDEGGPVADVGHAPKPNDANSLKPMDDDDKSSGGGGAGGMGAMAMMADGGPTPSPASSPSPVSKSSWDQFQGGFNKALGGNDAQAAEPQKKAMGGEMEPDGDEDGDMLMDQCAHECMEALKKGDKAAFKDSIMAMISECMSKMGGE